MATLGLRFGLALGIPANHCGNAVDATVADTQKRNRKVSLHSGLGECQLMDFDSGFKWGLMSWIGIRQRRRLTPLPQASSSASISMQSGRRLGGEVFVIIWIQTERGAHTETELLPSRRPLETMETVERMMRDTRTSFSCKLSRYGYYLVILWNWY